jgi:HTH-type transcriptional regulator/antitoxin HipB
MSYLLQTPDQLAVHLRALRLAKGWSQKQLAEKLSLSQSRIARIERDPLSISVDQMLKVLSILGASMRIELDASRSNLMLPSLQLAASGTVGSVSASQAGKTATKSEQGDW